MAPPRTAASLPVLYFEDRAIPVLPGETVLQTAERGGADLPSGCRVGGCGACRCRVLEGRVDEATESAYLLSAEELAGGVVLACQSVPLTDVRIEVAPVPGTLPGVVVGQTQLGRDLVWLDVQLAAPLAFRAGQHARLELASAPGVARTYSFASAPDATGASARVSFLVRRADGGRLSPRLCDEPLAGTAVRVSPATGDFALGPGAGPLVLVAGGSGLAPILAMLEGATSADRARPLTLVFGARTEAELALVDRITTLASGWRAPVRIVPVVEHPSPSWTGARGRVTEVLATEQVDGADCYLCGPPAMIDAACALLVARGVPPGAIASDRFTTRADATGSRAMASASDPPARVRDYLTFFGFHAIGLFALAALLAGGTATIAGLVTVLAFYLLGDAAFGDDTRTPRFSRPWILTAQLWLALPLLTATCFVAVRSVTTGDGSPASNVAALVLTGLMVGMVGTIPAHELTHRTWDPVSMWIGRWLLAFSFDTSFAIEHVHGHHRYVATEADPATAPRGRSVYAHILISTARGHRGAWHIEAARLGKRGTPVWTWRNAALRGYAMSVVLVLLAAAYGGFAGAAFFIGCGLVGKVLLEIVNYMEHYGLVRDAATPVAPRHSWNTNRRLSSWTMFHLTRHSHHHAQGEVPYHALRPLPGAPMMIAGYLTTIVLTLVPPLWHWLMAPRLRAWDEQHATPAERILAARASARSGRPELIRAHPASPA